LWRYRRQRHNRIDRDVPGRGQRAMGPEYDQQRLVIAAGAQQLERADQTEDQKDFEWQDRALPEQGRLELVDIAHEPVRAQILPDVPVKLPAIGIDQSGG